MKIEITLVGDDGTIYQGEAALHASGVAQQSHAKIGRTRHQASSRAKRLPDHILDLRGAGFFEEPKTPPEVVEGLRGKYHCELNRVEVALLRLQRRKELRKSSKSVGDKISVAYVW